MRGSERGALTRTNKRALKAFKTYFSALISLKELVNLKFKNIGV